MNDPQVDWTLLAESLEQVEYLQASVYELMWAASQTADKQVTLEYYHHLYALLDKQSVLYTRLKLMGQESLAGLLLAIEEYCVALGMEKGGDPVRFQLDMQETTKVSMFELSGDDPDDFDGIDVDFQWK